MSFPFPPPFGLPFAFGLGFGGLGKAFAGLSSVSFATLAFASLPFPSPFGRSGLGLDGDKVRRTASSFASSRISTTTLFSLSNNQSQVLT